jgi:archaemetzincin
LLEETADSDTNVLGIAGVDLFIPILTYVFGEAQLAGRAAVVSTYRLDPARYGLAANQQLLLDRLAKEAVHELGHTRGLVHCNHAVCVMRSSTYVEDIDLKSAQFCSACKQRIRAAVLTRVR